MSEKCHRCGGSGKEPDWRPLGKRARKERLRREITVRGVARLLGVSPSFISDIERGNRSWQGPKARRYLKMLGISP